MLKAKRIARFLLSIYFVMMGHMMFAHHHFEGCEHSDAVVSHDHEDIEHHGHHCHHHHHGDHDTPQEDDSDWFDELSDLFHIHFCTGDSELFTSTDQKPLVKALEFDADYIHSEVIVISFSVDVTHIDLFTPDEQPHAPPACVHRLRGPPMV